MNIHYVPMNYKEVVAYGERVMCEFEQFFDTEEERDRFRTATLIEAMEDVRSFQLNITKDGYKVEVEWLENENKSNIEPHHIYTIDQFIRIMFENIYPLDNVIRLLNPANLYKDLVEQYKGQHKGALLT